MTREDWCKEVVAWAEGPAAGVLLRGRSEVSSDDCAVVADDARPPRVGPRAVVSGAPLPAAGDPARPDAFDAEAHRLAKMLGPGVRRIAVFVGRVLVYVWAAAPEGDAEVIWMHDGALRADVARHDSREGESR